MSSTIKLYDVQNGDTVLVINGGLSGQSGLFIRVKDDESGLEFAVANPVTPPTISVQPADQTVAVGATATFTVTASGVGGLTYQWQKSTDGGTTFANVTVGTGGTTASYTTPTLISGDDASQYQVIVTNASGGGSTTSDAAVLTVETLSPNNWLLNGIASSFGILATLNLYAPPPVTKLTMGSTSTTVRDACRITSGANTGRIVAVGTSGFSAYSDDEGATWTQVTTAGTDDLVSVCWTGTNVVTVGISGISGRSSDGTSWTVQSITSGHRFGVAYYGGLLIAVGNDNTSQLSSDDGVTWTDGGTLPGSQYHAIGVNSSGLFVIGGQSGSVAHTSDGVTWTGTTVGSNTWQGAVYNAAQTLWAIVDNTGAIATSPDGATWTTQTAVGTGSASCINFANGLWVVGGGGSSSNVAYIANPTSGSWTLVSTSSRDVEGLLALAS